MSRIRPHAMFSCLCIKSTGIVILIRNGDNGRVGQLLYPFFVTSAGLLDRRFPANRHRKYMVDFSEGPVAQMDRATVS